jgi:hypothetical protein
MWLLLDHIVALTICHYCLHPPALVVGPVLEMDHGVDLLWRAVDRLQRQQHMVFLLDHALPFHPPYQEEGVTIGTRVLDNTVWHLPIHPQDRNPRVILLG